MGVNRRTPRAGSPRIDRLEWGTAHTEVGSFRDAKLWPGGGRGWDWNETGTHHSPGVQSDDVVELLDKGCQTVIIGRGQHRRLQVTDEARDLVEKKGAELMAFESSEAVARYNSLAEDDDAVGALIHSTC